MPARRALALGGASLLGSGRASAQSGAITGTITGTAAYRERIALPPGAVLDVTLLDVSRADAPAETLAMVSLVAQSEVPIRFVLAYDPARIDPVHHYALRATLAAAGRVMWRTDTSHPVLTHGAGTTVELRLVRSEPAAVAALVGPEWVAVEITGQAVLATPRTTLTFTPEGNAQGLGACNRFNGGYTLKDQALAIGPLASTMMACPPAIADQEQRFHQALGAVKAWRIEAGALQLLGADGAALVRLAARS